MLLIPIQSRIIIHFIVRIHYLLRIFTYTAIHPVVLFSIKYYYLLLLSLSYTHSSKIRKLRFFSQNCLNLLMSLFPDNQRSECIFRHFRPKNFISQNSILSALQIYINYFLRINCTLLLHSLITQKTLLREYIDHLHPQ